LQVFCLKWSFNETAANDCLEPIATDAARWLKVCYSLNLITV
jgi:hypothetical protein